MSGRPADENQISAAHNRADYFSFTHIFLCESCTTEANYFKTQIPYFYIKRHINSSPCFYQEYPLEKNFGKY
jgi:hypothetical protein